jgi:hypothetical protein
MRAKTHLVLVTSEEVRTLGLRPANRSLGKRTVHGQKHVFTRVGPSQLRALCEHSGRRKGVKVKVGCKCVRAFPPVKTVDSQRLRSASRKQLLRFQEVLAAELDELKGSPVKQVPSSEELRFIQENMKKLAEIEPPFPRRGIANARDSVGREGRR